MHATHLTARRSACARHLALRAIALCAASACSAPARHQAGTSSGPAPRSASTPPVSSTSSAPATSTALAAPAFCAASATVVVAYTADPDRPGATALTVSPADRLDMGPFHLRWRGDLNADGLSDIIVRAPDACGNWGECPYAVLAGCGGDTYAIVWSPDYAVRLEVDASATEVAGAAWRDLIQTVRVDAHDTPRAEAWILRWDGRAYQRDRAAEPAKQSGN